MIPPGIEPQCHRMFITVPTVAEKHLSKKKRGHQDIRKLLGNPSNNKTIGEYLILCSVHSPGVFVPDTIHTGVSVFFCRYLRQILGVDSTVTT